MKGVIEMNFITVDEHNIKEEHICCAISDKKGENCVGSKKAWLNKLNTLKSIH